MLQVTPSYQPPSGVNSLRNKVTLFNQQKEQLPALHRAANLGESGIPRDFMYRCQTSPLETDKKGVWELDVYCKLEDKGLLGEVVIAPKAYLRSLKQCGAQFIKCTVCNHRVYGPFLAMAGGHIRLYSRESSRPYLVDGVMYWCGLECYLVYVLNFPSEMCKDPKRKGDVYVKRDTALAAGVASTCMSVWSNKLQAGPTYIKGLSYLEVGVGEGVWEPVKGAGAPRQSVPVAGRELFTATDDTTVGKWFRDGVVYRDVYVQQPVMVRLVGGS
jgi:hypothetical protein